MKLIRNIYLELGIILCALFFVLLGFDLIEIDRQLIDDSSYKKSLVTSLIMFSIIGPILEEIAFRLNIKTKNKWMLFISSLVAAYFIFYGSNIILAIILFLAFLFSIIFYSRSNTLFALDIQIIVTSIVFSIMHFTAKDITTGNFFSLCIFTLYFFGIGLILAWLRVNFKFYTNVIAHVLFNSLLMFLAIYPSLKNNIGTKHLNCGDLQLSYSERSIFNDEDSKAFFNQDTLVFKNTNIIYMLDLYLNEENIKSNFTQTNGFIYYDLKLPEFYETSPQDILNCLEENELIKKKHSVQVDAL